MDQAYFKGAVEILRHLNEVDFGRLYGGQIALQDLDKVHFLLRKEVVRLPRFLNSAETLKTYTAHCRRLIKENQIEAAIEKVCKPVFIRTAREFFKQPKQKVQMNATITIGESENGKEARSASVGASRPMDAERLADLARPRQLPVASVQAENAATAKVREFDRSRVLELSLPRRRVESEAEKEPRCTSVPRAFNLARLEDLAKPRQLSVEYVGDGSDQKREGVERRGLDPKRLFELAMPRRAADTESTSNDNPDAGDEVPPPPKPLDALRLAELAEPKKKCEEDKNVPCKCPPKKSGSRRKRRSKCRILAMVQERNDIAEETAEEEHGMEPALETIESVEEDEHLMLQHADSLDNFVNAHDSLAEDEALNTFNVDRRQNAGVGEMIPNTSNQSSTVAVEQGSQPPHRSTSQDQPRVSMKLDQKPRYRAVARARSLGAPGALGADANFDAAESRRSQPGAANGIGGRTALPFEDVGLGGLARRQRLIGAVNGTSAAAVLGAGGIGSLWKPVPVKVMQFEFCL
jgi:hypothetical protein